MSLSAVQRNIKLNTLKVTSQANAIPNSTLGAISVNGGALVTNLTNVRSGNVHADYFYGDGTFLENTSIWETSINDDISYTKGKISIGKAYDFTSSNVNGSVNTNSTYTNIFNSIGDESITFTFDESKTNIILHNETGYVGFNINEPAYDLDISGEMKITGDVTITSNITVNDNVTSFLTDEFTINSAFIIVGLDNVNSSNLLNTSGIVFKRNHSNDTSIAWDELNNEFAFVECNLTSSNEINITNYTSITTKSTIIDNIVNSTRLIGDGSQLTNIHLDVSKVFSVDINESSLKYIIDGNVSQSVSLERGKRYVFNLSNISPSYPFILQDKKTNIQYDRGVSYNINHTTSTKNLYIDVPYDIPHSLKYVCSNVSGMGGDVAISEAVLIDETYNNYIKFNNNVTTFSINNSNIMTIGNGSIGIGFNSETIQPPGALNVEGNIKINGSINPSANSTYDLGSVDNKWNKAYINEVYLSGDSLFTNGTRRVYTNNVSEVVIDTDYIKSTQINTTTLSVLEGSEYVDFNKWKGVGEDIHYLGNVSIGSNITHSDKLHVTGNVSISYNTSVKDIFINGNRYLNLNESVWTNTSNIVHYDAHNIGINRTQPMHRVDVQGTVNATNYRGDGSLISGLPSSIWTGDNYNEIIYTSNNSFISNKTDTSIYYLGNVGIGVDNPLARLHINSSIIISNNINNPTSLQYNGTIRYNDVNNHIEGYKNGNFVKLSDNQVPDQIWIANDSSNLHHVSDISFVGIGTSNPTEQLDIIGNASYNSDFYLNGTKLVTTVYKLNILENTSVTTDELNKLTNIESNATQLDYLNTALGISTQNKALIADENKNIRILNNLTVNNLIINNDMNINGSTALIKTDNLVLTNYTLILANNRTVATGDSGFIFNRGNTPSNISFIWDETNDKFSIGFSDNNGTEFNDTILINEYVNTITNNTIVDINVTANNFIGDGSLLSNVIDQIGNTYSITLNGTDFLINNELYSGNNNIKLIKGIKYVFNTTSLTVNEPFYIMELLSNNTYIPYNDSYNTPNGIYGDLMEFTVPYTASNNLYIGSNNTVITNIKVDIATLQLSSFDPLIYQTYIGVGNETILNTTTFVVNGTERMRILSNNNVGINTINPTEKLDVEGNIKTDGNIYSSSNNTYNLGTNDNRATTGFINNIYLNDPDSSIYINNEEKIRKDNNGNLLLSVRDILSDISTVNTSILNILENGNMISINKWKNNINQSIYFDNNVSIGSNASNGQRLYVSGDTHVTGQIINVDSIEINNKTYIPLNESIWSNNSFKIHYASKNVGINISEPADKLHVGGNITAISYRGDGSLLESMNSDIWTSNNLSNDPSSNPSKYITYIDNTSIVINGTDNDIYYMGGNVGFGINNPLEQLHINGSMALGLNTKDNTSDIINGTIEYDGGNICGFKRGAWESLTTVKSDASNIWKSGNNGSIYFSDSNAVLGPATLPDTGQSSAKVIIINQSIPYDTYITSIDLSFGTTPTGSGENWEIRTYDMNTSSNQGRLKQTNAISINNSELNQTIQLDPRIYINMNQYIGIVNLDGNTHFTGTLGGDNTLFWSLTSAPSDTIGAIDTFIPFAGNFGFNASIIDGTGDNQKSIGIGISNPQYTLDVNGSLNIGNNLYINGTILLPTASELNFLNGLTVTTDELNLLASVKATTDELNYMENISNVIGVATPNKPLVSDALLNLDMGSSILTTETMIVLNNMTIENNNTILKSDNLYINNHTFILNQDIEANPTEDAGFILNRGDNSNIGFIWNETSDRFMFPFTPSAGSDSNVSITVDALTNMRANDVTVETNVTVSTNIIGNGSNLTGVVPDYTNEFNITIQNNRFNVDNNPDQTLTLIRGQKYNFDITSLTASTPFYIHQDDYEGPIDISSNLSHWWKMDEVGSMSVAYDSIQSTDLSLSNYPTDPSDNWTYGKINGALLFDGSSNYISNNNEPTFVTENSTYTLALWVYIEEGNGSIINIASSTLDRHGIQIKDDILMAGQYNGLYTYFSSDGAIALNNWYHVCLINRNAGDLSFYINGISQTSTTGTFCLGGDPEDEVIRLGYSTCINEYFDGLISDVRIYNASLNADQVHQLYSMQKSYNHENIINPSPYGSNIIMTVPLSCPNTLYYSSNATANANIGGKINIQGGGELLSSDSLNKIELDKPHALNATIFYTNGSERMRIHENNSVSIGTLASRGKLDIGGNVKVESGYDIYPKLNGTYNIGSNTNFINNAFVNEVYLDGSSLYMNDERIVYKDANNNVSLVTDVVNTIDVCVTNLITNSGDINKWSGSTDIYHTTGNVSIGINTSNSYRLNIAGEANVNGTLIVDSLDINNKEFIPLFESIWTNTSGNISYMDGTVLIGSINTNINNNSKDTLTVDGNINATNFIGDGTFMTVDTIDQAKWSQYDQKAIRLASNNVTEVFNIVDANPSIYYNSGNVGINQINPVEKLHVGGPIILNGSTASTSVIGTIRYNNSSTDFECYNNDNQWISLIDNQKPNYLFNQNASNTNNDNDISFSDIDTLAGSSISPPNGQSSAKIIIVNESMSYDGYINEISLSFGTTPAGDGTNWEIRTYDMNLGNDSGTLKQKSEITINNSLSNQTIMIKPRIPINQGEYIGITNLDGNTHFTGQLEGSDPLFWSLTSVPSPTINNSDIFVPFVGNFGFSAAISYSSPLNDKFVGIGTSQPQHTLDVRGNVSISDSLYIKESKLLATALELNNLTDITASQVEINKLSSIELNATQLNYLAGITLGTSAVNKAITTDSNSNLLIPDTITVYNLYIHNNATICSNTTVIETDNLVLNNYTFILAQNQLGPSNKDAGIIINRGDSSNVVFLWNETIDRFQFAHTPEDGTSSNISLTIDDTLLDLHVSNIIADTDIRATTLYGNGSFITNAYTETTNIFNIDATPTSYSIDNIQEPNISLVCGQKYQFDLSNINSSSKFYIYESDIIGPVSNNITHWWKFNEQYNAQNVSDSISTLDLPLTNYPSYTINAWTDGNIDGALQFTQSNNESLLLASNIPTEISVSNDYSITGWFYIDTLSGTSGNTSIIEISHGSSDRNGIQIRNNKLVGGYYDSAYTSKNSLNPINLDQWYHVVLTKESNIIKLYLDTVLQTDTSEVPSLINTAKLNIGYQELEDASFDGKISDIRLYNKVLTDEQIYDLYKLQKTYTSGITTSNNNQNHETVLTFDVPYNVPPVLYYSSDINGSNIVGGELRISNGEIISSNDSTSISLSNSINFNRTIFNTNNVEAVRIDENNNIGIGIKRPLERLEIDGSMRVNGTMYPSSNASYNLGSNASHHSIKSAYVNEAYISGASLYIDDIKRLYVNQETDELSINIDNIEAVQINASSVQVQESNTLIDVNKWKGAVNLYHQTGNVSIGSNTSNNFKLNVEGEMETTNMTISDTLELNGVPYNVLTESVWSNNSNDLSYISKPLGIGTTSSRDWLRIHGDINATNFIGDATFMTGGNLAKWVGGNNKEISYENNVSTVIDVSGIGSEIYYNSGNISIGISTTKDAFNVNGSIIVNGSTNANTVNGTIRYNNDLNKLEGHQNGNWISLTENNKPSKLWSENVNNDIYYGTNGSNKQLGIGTNTPNYTIDVIGNVSLSSNLYINGSQLTASASELNIFKDVVATTSELNKLDGLIATSSDLNLLTGTIPGTVNSQKSIVVDGNTDLNWSGNLTLLDINIHGNIVISGDNEPVILQSDNLVLNNNTLKLSQDQTGSPTRDAGIIINRGTEDNVVMYWNETGDKFQFALTNENGSSLNPTLTTNELTNIHINDALLTSEVNVSSNLIGNGSQLTNIVTDITKNIVVTSDGSSYYFNDEQEQNISLIRGNKYTFNLENITTDHPFYIYKYSDNQPLTTFNGVTTDNGQNYNSVMTFTVPFNTDSNLYYNSNESGIVGGDIDIIDRKIFSGSRLTYIDIENQLYVTKNNESMRICSNNNVGLGISNPQHQLDVNGGVMINGTIYSGSNGTYDIGTNDNRFNKIFIRDVYNLADSISFDNTPKIYKDENNDISLSSTLSLASKVSVLNSVKVLEGSEYININNKWLGTSNIYHNTGNVSIGTTDIILGKLRVEGNMKTSGSITTDTILLNNERVFENQTVLWQTVTGNDIYYESRVGINMNSSPILVNHWKFDEIGNTSITIDSVGTINGTLTDFPADPSVHWINGVYGNAIDMNGTNGYIDIGVTSPLLSLNEHFTMSIWFNISVFDFSPLAIFQTGIRSHGITVKSNKLLMIGYSEGGTWYSLRYPNIHADKWYHIAYINAGGTISGYLNGEPLIDYHTELAGGDEDGIIRAGPTINTFGYSNNWEVAHNQYLDGKLDDARIYNRPLSREDVNDLYRTNILSDGIDRPQYELEVIGNIQATDYIGEGGLITNVNNDVWSQNSNYISTSLINDIYCINNNSENNDVYLTTGSVGIGSLITEPGDKLHIGETLIINNGSTNTNVVDGTIKYDGTNYVGYINNSFVRLDYYNKPTQLWNKENRTNNIYFASYTIINSRILPENGNINTENVIVLRHQLKEDVYIKTVRLLYGPTTPTGNVYLQAYEVTNSGTGKLMREILLNTDLASKSIQEIDIGTYFPIKYGEYVALSNDNSLYIDDDGTNPNENGETFWDSTSNAPIVNDTIVLSTSYTGHYSVNFDYLADTSKNNLNGHERLHSDQLTNIDDIVILQTPVSADGYIASTTIKFLTSPSGTGQNFELRAYTFDGNNGILQRKMNINDFDVTRTNQELELYLDSWMCVYKGEYIGIINLDGNLNITYTFGTTSPYSYWSSTAQPSSVINSQTSFSLNTNEYVAFNYRYITHSYESNDFIGIGTSLPNHSMDIHGNMSIVGGNISINNELLSASVLELNILKDMTTTPIELNLLSGLTPSTANFNTYLADSQPGLVYGEKVIVSDSDRSIKFMSGTVTANDMTVSGNLEVNGTLTTLASSNLRINDTLMRIGNAQDGQAPLYDLGLVIERGVYVDTAIVWNESGDEFRLIDTYDSHLNTSLIHDSFMDLRMNDLSTDGNVTFSGITGDGSNLTGLFNGSWIISDTDSNIYYNNKSVGVNIDLATHAFTHTLEINGSIHVAMDIDSTSSEKRNIKVEIEKKGGTGTYDQVQSNYLANWWKFDQSGNATILENSINNINGTLTGFIGDVSSSWINTSIINGGLDFDGSSEYVNLSSCPMEVTTEGTYSITTWIYPHVTTTQGIVTLSHGTDNRQGIKIVSGKINGGYKDASDYFGKSSASSIVANRWYHIVLTVNNTDVKLYVNGEEETAADSGFLLDSVECRIGYDATTGGYFDGIIGDMRIYSTILDEEDIRILYKGYKIPINMDMTTGYIGINNENPQYHLDVNETILVSGGIGIGTVPQSTIHVRGDIGNDPTANTDVIIKSYGKYENTDRYIDNLSYLWKLNDKGKTITVQEAVSSLSTLSLTLTGYSSSPALSWVSGYEDKGGLDFDGVTNYLTTASTVDDVIRYEYDFTISMWIYPRAIDGSIISISHTTNDRSGIQIDESGILTAGIYNGSTVKSTSGSAITLNQWYHVALVNTNNQISFYINGNLQTSTSGTLSLTSTVGVYIGYTPDGQNEYFDGIISDIRIHNAALSINNIKELVDTKFVHINFYVNSSTGYVGMNTDNPVAKLHVNGTLNVNNININANIFDQAHTINVNGSVNTTGVYSGDGSNLSSTLKWTKNDTSSTVTFLNNVGIINNLEYNLGEGNIQDIPFDYNINDINNELHIDGNMSGRNYYGDGSSLTNMLWEKSDNGIDVYTNYSKIGISKSDPITSVDVNGTVRATNFYGDGSGLLNFHLQPHWDNTHSPNISYVHNASIGLGTRLPNGTHSDIGGITVNGTYKNTMKHDSLQNWWKFNNEGNNSVITDHVSGNDGTFEAGFFEDPLNSGWTEDHKSVPGNALKFDNSHGVTVTDIPFVKVNGYYTISMWIYPTENGNGGVFNIARGVPDKQGFIQAGLNLYFAQYDGATTLKRGVLTLNSWHHIVGICDGGTLTFMMNGIEITATNGGVNISASSKGFGLNHLIGYFKGNMTDARLFDRPLSKGEAIELYQTNSKYHTGFTIESYKFNKQELKYWWRMDDTYNDQDNESMTETITGVNADFITTGSTSSTITVDRFGKRGSAVFFDGLTHKLKLKDITYVNESDNFTISTWIYHEGGTSNEPVAVFYVGTSNRIAIFVENRRIICSTYDGTYSSIESIEGSISKNQWHHIVFINSASSKQLYVDGVPYFTTGTVSFTSTDNYIGYTDSPSTFYKGRISDFRIYSFNMSNKEARELYQPPLQSTLFVSPNTENTKIGIGTNIPVEKLHITNGDVTISSGDILINGIYMNVPDYVFENGYELMPIDNLTNYLAINKHLPNIKYNKEYMENNRYEVNDMNMKLLEKIEELTLYKIHQNNEIEEINNDNIEQDIRLKLLEDKYL